ncbi:hypothetical protein NC651_028151 [Populus alba x Populus x berolinensis]|nr:hypothetical protein NC651_028151 [Populus alba x Populus x berolinensis]
MDAAFKISGPLSSSFLLYILPYSPSSPNPSPAISQKALKAQVQPRLDWPRRSLTSHPLSWLLLSWSLPKSTPSPIFICTTFVFVWVSPWSLHFAPLVTLVPLHPLSSLLGRPLLVGPTFICITFVFVWVEVEGRPPLHLALCTPCHLGPTAPFVTFACRSHLHLHHLCLCAGVTLVFALCTPCHLGPTAPLVTFA